MRVYGCIIEGPVLQTQFKGIGDRCLRLVLVASHDLKSVAAGPCTT